MISTIIFCLCLFLAIWYTVISVFRACYKLDLGYQLLIFGGSMDRRYHTSYAHLVKGATYERRL